MAPSSKFSGFAVTLLLGFSLPAFAQDLEIDIDHTCVACTRRVNDSVNVFGRRAVRVDQAGYLPGQSRKIAYVAVPGGGGFRVVDTAGRTAFSGTLRKLGDYPRPKISARGFRNAITMDYSFDSPDSAREELYLADFSGLKDPARYRVVSGNDTSADFLIHPLVYDKVLEKVLFFFGASRCGKTDSWLHQACHLKDGSYLGPAFSGRLAGGWHDCGDHGKYSETTAYAALVLSLAYAIWPDRAPDRYGKSYADRSPDGIPDLLAEAKIGADYIYTLYTVSKERGLLDSSDIFHSVGMGPGMDYTYWGLPENQENLPQSSGGPDRPVARGIGSNVAGSFAAVLALFSSDWKSRDPAYAAQMESAAVDIYDRIVRKRPGTTTKMPCCYPGSSPTEDDEAMAALALWYATGEPRFGDAVLKLIAPGTFQHGGWTTDFENIHSLVLYGLAKLLLPDAATASRYGIAAGKRDSLLAVLVDRLRLSVMYGSNGSDSSAFPGTGINADEPYHGVFTSVDWGFNRYNLGIVTDILMYYDLTGKNGYLEAGLDNIHYLLGANPYDISFITGCGDRNLQHPHYRASNPDGYNQGGTPYPYRQLTGTVSGGAGPTHPLLDAWDRYDNTESCIDFAAQAVFPLLILAKAEGVPVPARKAKAAVSKISLWRMRTGSRDALGRKADPAEKGKLHFVPSPRDRRK